MKSIQKDAKQNNLYGLNNIFAIFDRDNESYLQVDKIQQWIQQVEPNLQDLTSYTLVEIYKIAADVKVFDYKFIQSLCSAVLEKLNDFSYTDLANILHSLQKIHYSKNISFIEVIVKKLAQFESCDDTKSLSTTIWSLSKLGFRDEEFFKSWKIIASQKIHIFSTYDLLKSIQAIATLKFFDDEFLNLWIQKAESCLHEFESRAKLNIAFYLSMLSINNFDNETSSLKEKIHSLVSNIIAVLDLEAFQDKLAKQQILQISLSKTCAIDQSFVDKLRHDIQIQNEVTTSVTQMRVESFIRKAYPKFEVITEYYDVRTSSSIDLVVKRHPDYPEYDVYIEVDGPTHYFINHQPDKNSDAEFNAATEFRNKLYKQHSFQPYVISYVDIDNCSYYSNLLGVLNTYPGGIIPFKQSKQPFEVDATISTDKPTISKSNGIKADKGSKVKVARKHKASKTNKIISSENDDFDQVLQEFVRETNIVDEIELSINDKYAQIEKEFKGVSKFPSLKAILKKLIESREIKSIEKIDVVLHHHTKLNPQLFDSEAYFHELLEPVLRMISSGMQKNLSFQIYNLFLRHGLKVSHFSKDHLKALIYAFSYGDVEIFQRFLSLIPESANKKQLMEYFFINCGALNLVEIADLLLNSGIDINVCYTRESVEVLYALATGKKHNGNTIMDAPNVLNLLYNSLVGSRAQDNIENLLQKASKGNFDKGEGVPEGRGITALHLSCYQGEKRKDIISFLLRNNANPNTMNKDDFTPLITALLVKDEDTALQILDFNPNIKLKFKGNLTLAHIAAQFGLSRVLKKIIDLGGDLDAKIKGKISIVNNKGEIIEFYSEETPLIIALKFGYIEIAEKLIETGVSLSYAVSEDAIYKANNALVSSGISILSYCIIKYPELVDKLLDNGVKIDLESDPVSPLMIAAELSNLDTRKRFGGIDAYNKAVEFNKLKIFKKLLLHGANISFKDRDGDTVEAYTRVAYEVSKHNKIIVLLQRVEEKGAINIELRKALLEGPENPKITYTYPVKDILLNLNLCIKSGNLALDIDKLYLEPTFNNLEKVVIDLNYLAGIYYGTNIYSAAVTVYDVSSSINQGNYMQAFMSGITSIAFMSLKNILEYTTQSYPVYVAAALTVLEAYDFATKLENFIEESYSEEQKLKSFHAYSELYRYLSNTSLQKLIDFEALANDMDMKIIGSDDSSLNIE